MIAEELPSQPQPVDLRFNQLTAESYEELRCVAARYLQGERAEHTLQATALVHEAFLRLVRLKEIPWQNRAHLVALAAGAMRRVLISYGRARLRLKRGGPGATRLPLDEAFHFSEERALDLDAVDEALRELEIVDARQAQIVEMRFFAGLTVEEIATQLRLSRATVKRDWATAKVWLRARLSQP
ncbi:MAG: ECF-type sigma factor [Chthoniobacterales bacterium]|jgi:RNA polymerase sigma-70 factor (ECF subfamily)